MTITACSGGSSGPSAPATPPLTPVRWSWVNGGLGADSLFAVAGASAHQIYVASERGMLRFDGTHWQLSSLGNPEPRLRSMWVLGKHGFAVGDDGVIFRMDNDAWLPMVSPVSKSLRDVSGVSASKAYACGAGSTPGTGAVIAYDGSAWAPLADAPRELFGIWAAASNDFFVAGEHGYFAHYVGGALTPLIAESLPTIRDVWGTSSTNVYAVGDQGYMLHLAPTGVTIESGGSNTRLNSIAGSNQSSVHVVGDAGVLRHWNGTNWTTSDLGNADRMLGVWADADSTAWAVGAAGTVLNYDSAWRVRYLGTRVSWHATAFDFLVGEVDGHGSALSGGGSWGFVEPLRGITVFSDADAYAVGNGGAIYRFDGVTWTKQNSNTVQDLRGVSGLRNRYGDPIRMYAAGAAGTVLVWKGANWNPASLPPDAAGMNFVSVWAGAIDDVFAVADNSNMVLRYDDPAELGAWTLELTPTSGGLVAVTGFETNAYVATTLGEILRNDGNGWKHIGDVPSRVRAMQAVARNAFYAVGDHGMLRYYEGGQWSSFTPDYFGDFLGIWARNGFNTSAVGTNGAAWTHIVDSQAIVFQ